MDVAKDAYKRMRQIRLEKGITQAFVAEKAGFQTQQAYAKVEKGDTKLKFDTAVKVAKILGVSTDDFLCPEVKQNV